jgi:nucleoside-diphosphate-sugar epimerase
MAKRLKSEGFWTRGVDLKRPDFAKSDCDEFLIGDLRDKTFLMKSLDIDSSNGIFFDEIYQFAADMGGAGFVFTGENDADIMHNSALINLNLLESVHNLNLKTNTNKTKIFYSSSACMYPEYNQMDPSNPKTSEESAYPAAPDSEYGWEKLFSERIFLAFNRNHKIQIAIARYHNIFGPEGTFDGGREKAPAAICRKIAMAKNIDEIEIWGDGNQTRSFLYIDECIEATRKLMQSTNFIGPVNIGSEEMVTINQLVQMVGKISQKQISVKHINGPVGVRGRNSDNQLIKKELGWNYTLPLEVGLEKTYKWIQEQIRQKTNGD